MISDEMKKQLVNVTHSTWRDIAYELGGCDRLDALDFVISQIETSFGNRDVKSLIAYKSPDRADALKIVDDALSRYFRS